MISGFNTILGLFQLGAPAPKPLEVPLDWNKVQAGYLEFYHFEIEGHAEINEQPARDWFQFYVQTSENRLWAATLAAENQPTTILENSALLKTVKSKIETDIANRMLKGLSQEQTDRLVMAITYALAITATNLQKLVPAEQLVQLPVSRNADAIFASAQKEILTDDKLSAKLSLGNLPETKENILPTSLGFSVTVGIMGGEPIAPSELDPPPYFKGTRIFAFSSTAACALSHTARLKWADESRHPSTTETISTFAGSAILAGLAAWADADWLLGTIGGIGMPCTSWNIVNSLPVKYTTQIIEPAEGPHAADTPAPAEPATPGEKPKPGTQDGGGPVEEEPNPHGD